MRFDENLSAIHAYLCADGYVIKNPESQKKKYYAIGFRNTNLILLKDFQERFDRHFKIKPYLIEEQRCRLNSKELYYLLIKNFKSFYSWHWNMPELNNKLAKIWLRAYFDCEGWVTIQKRRNRHIGVDCVNKRGIKQVKKALKIIGIDSKLKFREKQKIYRLYIFGKKNIIKFRREIGFLHPQKFEKLNVAINDYVDYIWHFPKNNEARKIFVYKILKEKIRIKKPYGIRIVCREKINLEKLKRFLKDLYDIESILYKSKNGLGAVYYDLNINRSEEVQKLIKEGFISDISK